MRGFGLDAVLGKAHRGLTLFSVACIVEFLSLFDLFITCFVIYIDKLGISHVNQTSMSWSRSELRVRLVPFNMLKPSKDFLLIVLMSIFVILTCLRLFLVALWSLAGKGLTSGSLVLSCIFVSFPEGVPGQVRYLIVLTPDLYLPLYFGPSWLHI